jgi:A/G-specific adenine glycosylase
MARLFGVLEPLPGVKPKLRALADTITPYRRPGDYAQAVMDLGATVCTPRSPRCVVCPWTARCAARRRGDPEAFPAKAPKKPRPQRRTIALVVVRDDGAVWMRRRPEQGLLGGMLEIPSTPWTAMKPDEAAARTLLDERLDWQPVAGTVVHVFTHFQLDAQVWVAAAGDARRVDNQGMWIEVGKLGSSAIPSVMRKIIEHGLRSGAFAGRGVASTEP